MRGKVWLVVFLGLMAVAAGGGYWWAGRKPACWVEVVSDSKVIKVKVTDRKKFSEFVQKFVPCRDGQFILGEPVNISGPYRVSRLEVEFSDRPGKNRSRDGEKTLMTFGYEFFPDKSLARIRLQLEADFVRRADFARILPFIIAARADAVYNYTDTLAWMERKVKLEEFGWSLAEAGLSYD